jgi:hypothetical protein
MPGNWITHEQKELYMTSRRRGKTQAVSAVKAGISERSGRAIEQGKREDPRKKKRGRTRSDPLAAVWESELKPLLEQLPSLQPITLLEHLQAHHLDEAGHPIYQDSVLRTLQRRVKLWRVTEGPKREVMFRQEHRPGRLGLSDFTQLKKVAVTIKGQPLSHRLYHFRLAFSHWSHMKVVLGGESYTALAEGLQEALWRLGGVPAEHRTDSLSAAFKNISRHESEDITKRYKDFCQHYGMKATRNNRGAGHENGSVESAHGHIKRRIRQALLLRGCEEFDSLEAYQAFIDKVVCDHNRRNAKALSVERESLNPLPSRKTTDYTEVVARVSHSSTIDVRRVTYTVPSQLQGETLRIHLYNDRLLAFVGGREVCQLTRLYGQGMKRARQVDYRHVIHSLVKKPQAFRWSRLREELLPTSCYRDIWTYVDEHLEARQACRFIVGLLHLASEYDCEATLGARVLKDVSCLRLLPLSAYQSQFKQATPTCSDLRLQAQHALSEYDELINQKEVRHATA